MNKYLPIKFWVPCQALSHSESGLITEHPCEMDIYPLQEEIEVRQVRLHSEDHAARKQQSRTISLIRVGQAKPLLLVFIRFCLSYLV